jgi:hypothetical protein
MEEENLTSNLDLRYESTKEELAEFFITKFGLSEEIKENIINEDISGDILLYLKDNDFIKLGIKEGDIEKIEYYIRNNIYKFIEKEIKEKIDENSTVEDVDNFFKKIIGFNGKLNNIDGKKFLNLTYKNVQDIGLNIGQTKKFEKYFRIFTSKDLYKKINSNEIKKESPKTKIKGQKIKKPKSKEEKKSKSVNKKDNNILLNKGEEKIDNNYEILDKSNYSNSFIWSLIPNLNFSGIWSTNNNEDSIKENLIKNNVNKNNDNIIINPNGTILSYIQYKDILYTNIEPLYNTSNFNIFLILVINQEYYNSCLGFYEDNSCFSLWKVIVNYNHIFLLNEEKTGPDNTKKRIILMQIPSDRQIHRLLINLLNNEKGYNKEIKTKIEIKEEIQNYFLFKNLIFGGLFPEEKIDYIFMIYSLS